MTSFKNNTVGLGILTLWNFTPPRPNDVDYFHYILLFASCSAMNMVIYRQTKILLRESRTVEAATDNSVVTNNQTSTVVTSMAVHVGRNKLGQLEIEATWTLIMGVTSLCVMPCLNILLIASFLYSRLIFGQSACNNFNGMWPFLKEISLTPAIYGLRALCNKRNKKWRQVRNNASIV